MLLEQLPIANRVLGEDHEVTLSMQRNVVINLLNDPESTKDDASQAERTARSALTVVRRVFGAKHPQTRVMESWLRHAQNKLETFGDDP